MRTLFDPPSSHEPTRPAAPVTPTIRPDGQRACAVCGAPAPWVHLFHNREGSWPASSIETRFKP
jgi:hypothetical protein